MNASAGTPASLCSSWVPIPKLLRTRRAVSVDDSLLTRRKADPLSMVVLWFCFLVVGLDPVQCRHDGEYPLVARGRILLASELSQVEVSQQPQAMIRTYNYYVVG